jgi:hypothetical protein
VALGAKLETLLPVRSLVRVGDTGECDSIYLLAGLHTPCLSELVDGLVAPDLAARRYDETYLRVAVSPHGRFAVLLEVHARAERADGALVVTFEPQPGVVDRRLQPIVKGLQGALRRARFTVLDLAMALGPVDEASLPEGDDRPTLWSCLFEDHSPLAHRACGLPCADSVGRQPRRV